MQTLVGVVLLVKRQPPLAAQVMQAEHIQIGIQRLRSLAIASKVQAHRRNFCRTEMIIALERRRR